MKEIQFTVDESPTAESVINDEYVFGIHVSNAFDDELKQTIETMAELWKTEAIRSEVALTINVRLRDVYDTLHETYSAGGEIDEDCEHLFDALKRDCQWIVDQIAKIKVKPSYRVDSDEEWT